MSSVCSKCQSKDVCMQCDKHPFVQYCSYKCVSLDSHACFVGSKIDYDNFQETLRLLQPIRDKNIINHMFVLFDNSTKNHILFRRGFGEIVHMKFAMGIYVDFGYVKTFLKKNNDYSFTFNISDWCFIYHQLTLKFHYTLYPQYITNIADPKYFAANLLLVFRTFVCFFEIINDKMYLRVVVEHSDVAEQLNIYIFDDLASGKILMDKFPHRYITHNNMGYFSTELKHWKSIYKYFTSWLWKI